MKRSPILHVLPVLLTLVLSMCSGSRPLERGSLSSEASRYAVSYERGMALGRYHSAHGDARSALEVSKVLDDEALIALSYNNLGAVQERLGSLEEAKGSYAEAVKLSRKSGALKTLAASLNNLAGLVVEEDPGQAEILAGEAFRIGQEQEWKRVRARAAHVMARAALARGNTVRAVDLGREALDHAASAGEPGIRAAIMVTIGRSEAGKENFTDAVRLIEQALVIDRDLENPFAIMQDHERLAEVLEAAGKFDQARASRAKAAQIRRILRIEHP